jgi:four helix bundle protein
MNNNKPDIAERSVQYSIRIIKLYKFIEENSVGKIIGKQLLRSGTSIGANIHEAQGGQSTADFIAKMSIAHKEARESAYWIRLLKETDIVPSNRIEELADETDQIIKIISSILITAKKNKKKK